MNPHIELHFTCLCVLLILGGSLVGRKQGKLQLLTAACLCLLAAVALRLLCWEYAWGAGAGAIPTLRELCETDPALAASGMDNLSGYLRENIDALSERELIPFEQELEYIRHYVALEKLRPSEDFQVYYDLAMLDFAVPALSIQPLVENAIRHGVRGIPDGEVVLSTEQRGDMIRVIVEDNGPGFPKNMSRIKRERSAHAMENVSRRLESQCGGTLYPRDGENGARMVVLLPKRKTQ